MKILELKITEEYSQKFVRDILKNHFKLSSAIITKLKKDSLGILVNGSHATVAKKLEPGDVLTLNIPDKKSENIEPVYMHLDIIYEDDDILAVNKPGNMPTHPSMKHHDDTLANGVMYYYKDTDFTFRAITRLDRETSGVVLIAKNALSAKLLSEQIKNGDILKEYTAVVTNRPPKDRGEINAPIKRVSDSMILRCVAPDGKPAITEYELIKEKNGLYLLKLIPKTGRTHQIRVHLSSIGSPILADGLYGTQIKGERCRLHCSKIEFKHPASGEKISITAPVPKDFEIKN